nr:Lrp/AsnC family transcriptional regulator [Brevibacterium marinum]
MDPVDRAIVDVLHRDGRAPWSRVAEQVNVSAATVRRRYETMHNQGVIRVIGATDVARLGLGTPIYMRLSNAHGDLDVLIPRLRSRKEVRSLNTLLGSVDIAAEMVLPPNADHSRLVADITKGTAATVETLLLTHAFASGQDWAPPRDTDEPTRLAPVKTQPAPPVELTRSEAKALGMLMHDGRTSLGDLANAIGKSENTASRTIDQLQEYGLLDFRILVEPERLGFGTEFLLWLEVEPQHLTETAISLSEHPSTKYLTATTGSCSLAGQFIVRDRTELFHYSTQVLASLPGIRSADFSIQTATHKRVWTSIEEGVYATAGQPLDPIEYLQSHD